MRIDSIRLINFQSFADSGEIQLANLTLFVGRNNSGKSTMLNALRQHQSGIGLAGRDLVRIGADEALVLTRVSGLPVNYRVEPATPNGRLAFAVNTSGNAHMTLMRTDSDENQGERPLFLSTFPQAVVVPLLADRSSRIFDETVNAQTATAVRHDTSNIAAVVSGLVSGSDPSGAQFAEVTKRLFDFQMGLIPSQNGLIPGLRVDESNAIPLSAMGTGVISILRMLAYLIVARDKIILIEEPENDLHPEALKQILKLVLEASRQNQVLVTTHSNIVVNVLGGSQDCRIYRVDMSLDGRIPTATLTECVSASDRLDLLRQLGHELTDFGLHEAFLILEEASAESIITRLIGWFAPKLLGRLRTVSAYGVNDVGPRLSDLKRLFIFVHLEDVYKDRAWVLVDGDAAGKAVVEGLKADFKTWDATHFLNLSQPAIESYYPTQFAERAAEIPVEKDVDKRRQLKKQLIVDVLEWVDSDEEAAKLEFETSAVEVIGILRTIEGQLVK